MKALVITDKGLEKVALMELKERIKIDGIASERVVEFEVKKTDDLFKFIYFSQAIERAMILIDKFEFKDYDDLLKKINEAVETIDFNEWFGKDLTFRVTCQRIGDHDFGSQDLEREVGEQAIFFVEKKFDFVPSVSMDSPDTIIYLFINNNQAYVGIDLVGKDLCKRQYRIFSSASDVNASLAYAVVRLTGFKKKNILADVFSKTGVFCIEAALFANNTSVNHYSKELAFKNLKPYKNNDWTVFFKKLDEEKKDDKLNISGIDPLLSHVESSRKNAKLAGVDKLINFSKNDIEWLDAKYEKGEVDIIVSKVPCPSKHVPEKIPAKIYKELFYQADYILKKGGVLGLIAENVELLKNSISDKFKLKDEIALWSGQQKYILIIIEKQ